VNNQPYGKTLPVILDTAYDNFKYKHYHGGVMQDLAAATIDDVSNFFESFYSPSNAVLSVVGDFSTSEALAKIRKYFESIPRHSRPERPEWSEPEQTSERRKTVQDDFARAPRIDIVHKIAPGGTPQWYPMHILGYLMVGGQSSRLYRRLVRDEQIASAVYGGADERCGPSLWTAGIIARSNADLRKVEQIVNEEFERVKNELVSDPELDRVRMQMRRQRAQSMETTLSRAILLGQYAVYYDNPRLINEVEERIAQITKEDLQREARRYLVTRNQSVVVTLPIALAGAVSHH